MTSIIELKSGSLKGNLINQAYEVNYPRYSGYQASDQEVRGLFFNTVNLRYISNKISEKLTGVHSDGKKIKVPDQQILAIMTAVSLNNYNSIELMNEMVINWITNQIKDEFELTAQNNKLNIWDSIFSGDKGQRQTSEIKIRDKHPTRMVFNMNY